MPQTYTLSVKNNTGSQQRYAIVNEAPTFVGRDTAKVWSNVLVSVTLPPENRFEVSITNQFYGFTGQSEGALGNLVPVKVNDQRIVYLGGHGPEGFAMPGTHLRLDVRDGAPYFDPEYYPVGSPRETFQILTPAGNAENGFTREHAEQNNWVIGLGGSVSSRRGFEGPLASFIPEPSKMYQIKPSNTYHILVGAFKRSAIIDDDLVRQAQATIDFNREDGDVTLVHDQWNRLTRKRD